MRSPEQTQHQTTEVRAMLTAALPRLQKSLKTDQMDNHQPPDVIETRLWIEEHVWLYGVLKSDLNIGPIFRFPDLISACVSLCRLSDETGALVLQQARVNMAQRFRAEHVTQTR